MKMNDNNYIGEMNLFQASIILSIIKESQDLKYPEGDNRLELMCGTILKFLSDMNLDETEFYKTISEAICGFNVDSKNDIEEKRNFDFIQINCLNHNAIKIAGHFKIPFSSL